MNDYDIIRESLSNLICMAPVGSRVTCSPAPTDTDADYIALVGKRCNPNGEWFLDGPGGHYEPSEGQFNSWRNGHINLILTDSGEFYFKFLSATKVAKELNLLDKKDRIVLFQAILYGR